MVSQSSQMDETEPIVVKSFEIKVEILNPHQTYSRSFEIDQFWGLIKPIQDVGSQPNFQDKLARARSYIQDII